MKTRILLTLLIAGTLQSVLHAQELTQTIRGRIVDDVSEFPLLGATIFIAETDPILGSSTDYNGEFKIEKVPIGRHALKVSYIGYESIQLSDVLVSTGKSVYLEIKLKESAFAITEVEIKGSRPKDIPLNEMSGVSARSFSVEESQRYAGGLDDPGRMVTAFAGVTSASLGQNAIVIRGNAPKGVQWRMEGIEIPNPSHFAGATVTGGGFVTLLSNNVLANSDFLTGAFPSEYGNALSGVFDMNLRSGNNEEAEHTFQVGLLGIDVASEGPISKQNKSSYLFNYRYSTLGLIEPILPDESNTIRYQDLSFKLNFPTTKAGEYSLWGVGGNDYGRKNREVVINPSDWEILDDLQDYDYGFNVGAAGIKHKINFGKNTMWQTSVAGSVNDAYWHIDQLNEQGVIVPKRRVENLTGQVSLSTVLNHKFSKRHHNRAGILYHQQYYNIEIKDLFAGQSTLFTLVNDDGWQDRWQIFSQSKYDLTKNLKLNIGVHSQYAVFNNEVTFEPRANLQLYFNTTSSLSLGYGKHSQMEDMKIYKVQDQQGNFINSDLKMIKADHIVLSYDWIIKENLRLKIEPYFQFLYDVPVVADSSFSMMNFQQDWFLTAELVNEGEGQNYGVDMTLERFLNNDFYYLITGSVFVSKYLGGDKIWRNTRFNRGYAFNILTGKEWQFGKQKNKWFGLNIGYNVMGGLRESPVDIQNSQIRKEVIYNTYEAFSKQNAMVNYMDITITYKKNKNKTATIWGLQVKNVLGSKEFQGHQYNFRTNQVDELNVAAVIPNLYFKVEF
ncbi:MAG: carboxypeptidase-like regulatory domain-containing protein [Cyclobacteriaceae bacterium]|nr:carboxypeptidase-like regulatory domain-containing protein [Cyclobacteriaceae bacterium]